MTMEFKDVHGKTLITWRMLFESEEIRDTVAKYAVNANEENYDRLEAELTIMS